MEIRHLEHFIAAAEEGHFTRAARRLNIVQSGLSASIKTLEAELGTPLFIRSPRGVVLTAAGRALLTEARRVLASVQHARDTVAATVGTLQGTVSIGLSIALPPDVDAPWLISEFRAAHPAVQVRLVHDASHRLFDRVRSGELDFAVAATTGAPPAGLTTLDLGTSPMVFACGPDHRLGRSEAVTLDTVAGETFVDFQRDWTIRRLVDIAFEAAGIARNSAYIVNEATYLLRFVERGLAVAILPEVFGQLHADVRYIPFHPGLPPWHAVGAHLGDEPAGAAARAMLKFSCDHVRAVRSVEHD